MSDLRSSARWMANCGTRRIGSVDPHQPVRDAIESLAVPKRQSPADAQITVQPGVQPDTAVGLQRHHLPARDLTVGVLLDPKIRAVGMTANDPKRPTAGVAPAVPGHQRPGAHGEEFARRGPLVCLGQLGVAGGAQPASHRGTDMERRRGRVDEFAQPSRRGRHVLIFSPRDYLEPVGTLGSNPCPLQCSRNRFSLP